MKQIFVVAALLSALYFVPGQATAQKALMSGPLMAGEGGLVCACTNLKGKTIIVDFTMIGPGIADNCNNQVINPGDESSCAQEVTSVRTCVVYRDDGKSVSVKNLVCTFATLDAAGNTTAVVPVDKKINR